MIGTGRKQQPRDSFLLKKMLDVSFTVDLNPPKKDES